MTGTTFAGFGISLLDTLWYVCKLHLEKYTGVTLDS